MSNSSIATGCPAPFIDERDFPWTGGQLSARMCTAVSPTLDCCLPCPLTDWVYPEDFQNINKISDWLNVGGLICCVILLLSFAVLPVKTTNRHYLTICLIAGITIMSTAFVIPLGTGEKPQQCHDPITPNNMYSDLTCAFTGSLVIFGGSASVMWVFVRSISLHLQICWQVVPGRKFLLGSMAAGWGIPALSLALSLVFSGVSYRLGSTCHINHTNGVATFWGPLLGAAALALVLQLITFAYCIKVYISSLVSNDISRSSNYVPSYYSPVGARAGFKRIKKLIVLQWRGIAVVIIVVCTVTFFSIVFISMDYTTTSDLTTHPNAVQWVACLLVHGSTEKAKCVALAAPLVESEGVIMAVLFLMAFNGYWAFLFLGRWSMVGGWIELIKKRFAEKEEFVSYDANRMSTRSYQVSDHSEGVMMTAKTQHLTIVKGADGGLVTKTVVTPKMNQQGWDPKTNPHEKDHDYFGPNPYEKEHSTYGHSKSSSSSSTISFASPSPYPTSLPPPNLLPPPPSFQRSARPTSSVYIPNTNVAPPHLLQNLYTIPNAELATSPPQDDATHTLTHVVSHSTLEPPNAPRAVSPSSTYPASIVGAYDSRAPSGVGVGYAVSGNPFSVRPLFSPAGTTVKRSLSRSRSRSPHSRSPRSSRSISPTTIIPHAHSNDDARHPRAAADMDGPAWAREWNYRATFARPMQEYHEAERVGNVNDKGAFGHRGSKDQDEAAHVRYGRTGWE